MHQTHHVAFYNMVPSLDDRREAADAAHLKALNESPVIQGREMWFWRKLEDRCVLVGKLKP